MAGTVARVNNCAFDLLSSVSPLPRQGEGHGRGRKQGAAWEALQRVTTATCKKAGLPSTHTHSHTHTPTHSGAKIMNVL